MADGMEPTDDVDDGRRRRAQHVLHPRERRQQALRPPRPPQAAEGRATPSSRSRSAAVWRRRTGAHPAQARPWVDVVFGTHNLPQRSTCCERPRDRWAADGDPRGAPRPSRRALPARAATPFRAWVTIQRRAATTRARSASCRSSAGRSARRAIGDILPRSRGWRADGVVEVTLLGQNVNSYGRDVTVPGSSPPAVRRPAARVDAVHGIRPDPVHVSPHPHDFTPGRDRGDGRVRAGVRAHPLPAAVGLATAVLKAMQRSYRASATWAGSSASAPRSPTSPCRPTSSWGSRARPRTTSPRRSRWSSAPRFDSAFMFQYSPRPGHPGRLVRRPDPQGGRPGAVRPAGGAAGADLARARHARRSGGTFEVLVEGAGEARTVDPGPHPHEQHRAPRRRARSRGRSSTPRSPTPRRITSPARSVPRRRQPWPSEAAGEPAAAARARRTHRVRQDRGRRSRWPSASAPRSSRSTRCWSTAAWTSARPSRRRPIARACRTTCSTSPSRRSRSRWPGSRSSPGSRSADIADAGARPLLVGRVRPVLPGGRGRARVPGHRPGDPRASSSGRPRRWVPSGCTRGWPRRPGCRREDRAGNVRRIVRALEVPAITGTPFSAFAAAWERYDPERDAGRRHLDRPRGAGGHGSTTGRGDVRRGLARRGPWRSWTRGSGTGSPRRRPSATLSWRATSTVS